MKSPIPRWAACAAAAALLAGHGGELAAIGPERPLEELIQTQWRQQDGLAQDTVYTLLQTRDGFLWCGTRAGLSRFDGARFATFDREELGLVQTLRIQALAEDSAGALWIGTGSGELLRYQGGVFQRFGAGDGLKGEGRAVGRIAGLAAGENGELWVGTYSEGVFRWEDGRFERVAATAGVTSITRLALDESGGLWIATIGAGVYRYRPGEPLLHLTRKEGLPNDYVSSLRPARGGGVYIGTHSGIALWRAGHLEVWGAARGLAFDHVTALVEDREGSVFFASYGGGIQRLRPEDGRVDRLPAGEPGREAIAWDIYEDRSGMVWTGTVDQGLLLLSEGAFSTWRAYGPDGLSSRLVTALAEGDDGTWWIGTRDAGLSWRRESGAGPAGGRIGRAEGLAADAVWSLDAEDGEVYAGTSRGLFRLAGGAAPAARAEPVPLRAFAQPPAVQALAHDRRIRYVGTDRGLLLLPKSGAGAGRLLTRAEGLPADEVLDLEPDGQGRMFVATAGGLAVFDGENLVEVRDFDRLGAGRPLALHASADGAIWVIPSAGGLARIAGGEAAWLGKADGLADDNLYGIAEDRRGRFWLGTSSGILRVERAALEARLKDRRAPLPQTFFDRFDGVDPGALAAFGKRALASRDGRLAFATFGGVALHSPAAAEPAGENPQALIEKIELDGGAAPAGKFGRIPVSHRHLAFGLAAPLPHAGNRIRLRYRLYGFDKDWTLAGPERRAEYSGLVPGLYRFEVQASDTAGEYVTRPAVYAFQVTAGFLQSWKLPATLLLVLAAGTWLFHLIRSRQLVARQKELDARIAAATADIRVLHGLLPLCGSCHQVRDDQGYWQQLETYLAKSTELEFTHGFCPDCASAMIAQLEEEPAPAGG